MNELIVADVDAYVADRVSTAAEEYQIARQKLIAGNAGGGVELRLRYALDRADRVLVNVGRKAGAVEAGRGAAAVDIRNAEELRGVVQNCGALRTQTGVGCHVSGRGHRSAYVVGLDVAGLTVGRYLVPAVLLRAEGDGGAVREGRENAGRGVCLSTQVYGRGAGDLAGGRSRRGGCGRRGRAARCSGRAADGHVIRMYITGLAVRRYLVPAAADAGDAYGSAVREGRENAGRGVRLASEVYSGRAGDLARTDGKIGRGRAGQIRAAYVALLAVHDHLIPFAAVVRYRNGRALGKLGDDAAARSRTQIKRICLDLCLIHCQRAGKQHRRGQCTGNEQSKQCFGGFHNQPPFFSRKVLCAGAAAHLLPSARFSQIEAMSIALHRLFFSVFFTIRSLLRTFAPVC